MFVVCLAALYHRHHKESQLKKSLSPLVHVIALERQIIKQFTREKESARLISQQFFRQLRDIAIQDILAPLE